MYQCPPIYDFNGMPVMHNSISNTNLKDYMPKDRSVTDNSDHSGSSELLNDYPQEVTWLFFRDNQWIPFQYSNHLKIEQAFTLGGN
ncbi:hypothetical protein BY458DRAFT_432342 [Sporodiniella umbellata]|nr:hypothetical protein BY458DRAFT_432342 [Sporodiniella umbellata]